MDDNANIEELVICRLADDGRLVDRCGWATLVDAETAAARFSDSDAGRVFGAYLETEGMVFLHCCPLETA